MKKPLLTLLTSLCLGALLHAQAYFPDPASDPKWFVGRTAYGFGGETHHQVECYYGVSATFCGHIYTEVIEDMPEIGYQQSLGYIRIDGPRVYALLDTSCAIAPSLIYDFSLEEGQSVDCGYNMSAYELKENTFTVSSTGTVDIPLGNRRYQRMAYSRHISLPDSPPTSMDWIAGVGSSKHPFYSLSCIGDFCEVEDTLYQLTLNGETAYDIVTASQAPTAYELSVYPTVFGSTFWIAGLQGKATARLFDSSGRAVFQTQLTQAEEAVNVAGLPNGLYFLEVREQGTGKRAVRRVVKGGK